MAPSPDTHASAWIWVRHQLALEALREALAGLESVGVPAVVVKGAVLAYTLHSDVVDRPISDVDLRVRPRDLHGVEALLGRRGWPVDRSSRQLGTVGFRIASTLVEVETSIGPPGVCSLTIDQMLTRSRLRNLPSGVFCREPELYDHTVQMVVNAYKDKIVLCPAWSLGDLTKLAELPEFDRTEFVRRVEESDIRTITWVVADWLAREQSADRWREIRDAIGPTAPRRHFAAAYAHLARRAPESLAMRMLSRVGADSFGNRVKAAAAMLLGSALAGARRRGAPA